MAFTSVATSLTHIISVTPYIADFISAYNSIQDFISFPTSMSIFFPNTPISKGIVYLSFLAFLSLSPPPLSLFFLAFGFFGFALTSFCSLASTGFSSGLASTGFFGFDWSGVLQNSFALYWRTFNENVSTGTMQMQNVIPNICLNKFSRKQLDMVVQWF